MKLLAPSEGFTLTEVLCAFVVLSLISLALVQSIEQAASHQQLVKSNRALSDLTAERLIDFRVGRDAVHPQQVTARTAWAKVDVVLNGGTRREKFIFSRRVTDR